MRFQSGFGMRLSSVITASFGGNCDRLPWNRPASRERATRLIVVELIMVAVAGCGPQAGGVHLEAIGATVETTQVPRRRVLEDPLSSLGRIQFTEISAKSGVDFIHYSGMTPEYHFPSIMGSGAAIFDHDGDGRMDLYFATATTLPVNSARATPNRLYKGIGNNRFVDVTESSGLGFAGFCHGIAIGDVDNDGDPDVFLAGFRQRKFYRNNGQGRFVDVTSTAGVESSAWSTCGAFLDYDNDGDLDLYVANYGDWVWPRDNIYCGNHDINARKYCSPQSVRPAKHSLLRNNGDFTFSDVTDAAGLCRAEGRGLGVVTVDANEDGKIDIYVANDMGPNLLFLNRGDGTFENATETAGAAYSASGQAYAGMGVDAEDVDGDGRPELFVTNYINEYNTLYHNLGNSNFHDETVAFGLGADTTAWVGWGCALADFDNDGWPDSFAANGAVDHYDGGRYGHRTLAEPPMLHRNIEGKHFKRATEGAGTYFSREHVGRGATFGDIDDDGDIDIVINHKGGPPALLRNDTQAGNHWIRLRLVGTKSNRDAVGARVEIEAGGRTIVRQRKGGASYASAHDPRLLVGLGTADVVSRLTVRWPSGLISRREALATNQTYDVIEPSP